jgi:hypothetical protein
MPRIQAWHGLLVLNVIVLSALGWTHARSQASPQIEPVIRARLIELVNDQGEMRAQLHVGEDGGGQLRLRSGDGEIRVKFGAGDDGAILLMMDSRTEPAVRLASDGPAPSLKLMTVGKPEMIVAP